MAPDQETATPGTIALACSTRSQASEVLGDSSCPLHPSHDTTYGVVLAIPAAPVTNARRPPMRRPTSNAASLTPPPPEKNGPRSLPRAVMSRSPTETFALATPARSVLPDRPPLIPPGPRPNETQAAMGGP